MDMTMLKPKKGKTASNVFPLTYQFLLWYVPFLSLLYVLGYFARS